MMICVGPFTNDLNQMREKNDNRIGKSISTPLHDIWGLSARPAGRYSVKDSPSGDLYHDVQSLAHTPVPGRSSTPPNSTSPFGPNLFGRSGVVLVALALEGIVVITFKARSPL